MEKANAANFPMCLIKICHRLAQQKHAKHSKVPCTLNKDKNEASDINGYQHFEVGKVKKEEKLGSREGLERS